jgi:hypothetical protein
MAITDVQHTASYLFGKAISEPLHKVIRQIAKNTINSLGALTTLLLNGYGNDGMKIVRGMFEYSVLASYLAKHPELLDDYFDYYHVKVKKQLDYFDKYAAHVVKGLLGARRAEIDAEYRRIKSKFTDSKGRLRGSWSKASIRDMASAVGLEEHYLTIYSQAASMHHMDISGLTLHADEKNIDADVAPSLEWIIEALVAGHQSAVMVLKQYNDVAVLGMEKEIDRLRDDFLDAWRV